MAKASRLPSGKWRALAYYQDENGKPRRKSFTAPTRKEAEFLANSYTYEYKAAPEGILTLQRAIEQYIEYKKAVLSPTTIINYTRMLSFFPESMLSKELTQITKKEIDQWISEQSSKVSPKTVFNRYSLLSSVFKYNEVYMTSRQLPKIPKMDYNVPTDEDIKTLIKYAKAQGNSELLLIIMMGAFGCMRRGEMCAVTPADVKGNVMHIHNNKVQVIGGTVTKAPKTVGSDRFIEIPAPLLKVLKDRDRYITSEPSTVSKIFKRAVKACKLPDYRLHDLRHYCCSVMHNNGCSDIYIKEYGGWTSEVFRNVYRNSMQDYQKMYSKKMEGVFSDIAK